VGKTQLVASLARSVNGKFNRVQFTPDVMPSDIMGFQCLIPEHDSLNTGRGRNVQLSAGG